MKPIRSTGRILPAKSLRAVLLTLLCLAGAHSLRADTIPFEIREGGVSIRRSAKITVNLGGARKITLSSNPAGLFATQVLHPEVNATFTSSNLNGNNGAYAFSHWEVNGQRQQDSKGIALSRITQTMDADKLITAHYVDKNLDSDADGILDWYEWHKFGTLGNNDQSNPDSDGFILGDERRFGLNGSIEDNVSEGGVSIRRSGLLSVNLGGGSEVSISSNPAGILQSQKQTLEFNSTFTSQHLHGASGGYYFSHWEINGVRQSDGAGIGLSKVIETLDSNKEIVAKYVEQNLDTDGDGIPDWYEMHELGSLAYNGSHDPDGDGFSIDRERQFGLSPSISDQTGAGGVSLRRALLFSFSQQGPVQPVDTDGDGLTDDNESAIGSNPNSSDSDGDGYGDYSEWLAGTNLLNANDFPNQAPSSLDLNGSAISENQPAGSIIGNFIVTDPNPNSTHLLSLVEGNGSLHNEFFLIDSNGTLRTTTIFDYELNSTLSIRARATDEYNATIEGNFTISIHNQIEDLDGDGIEDHFDVDDDGDGFSDSAENEYGSDPRNPKSLANAAPVALDLNGSTITENQPAGTIVGEFNATDPDSNATLFFSLLNTHHLFNLDANGTLRTLVSFDYETNATAHPLTVWVTDEHNESREGNFTIAIVNQIEDFDGDGIEDHYDGDDDGDGFSDSVETAYGSDPRNAQSVANAAPVSLDLNGSSILENLPVGSLVGQLTARDGDANATLSFSLVDGNGSEDNHLFSIDALAKLRTRAVFDYEANAIPSAAFSSPNDRNATPPFLASSPPTTDHNTNLASSLQPDRNASSTVFVERNGTGAPNSPTASISNTNRNSPIASEQNPAPSLSDFNASRRAAGVLDFQSGPTRLRIRIRVTDEHNASLEKAFLIDLLNEVEDFDGDGIEDAFDPDDVIYVMPTLEAVSVTVGVNGRVSFLSGFRPRPEFSLPAFAFQVSTGSDFNDSLLTQSAIVESNRLLGSLYQLKPGQTYHVRVLATHRLRSLSGESTRFEIPMVISNWWEKSETGTGNWRTSPWLGTFLPHPSGWIHHAQMDWLYAHGGAQGDLWLWNNKLGWLWTTEDVFPHLFGNSSSNWFYFLKKRDGIPLFYDYSTERVRPGK